MVPLNVVFVVPIAVPVGTGGVGWLRRTKPPPYATERRDRQSPWSRQAIPVRDLSEVRRMIAEAKRLLSEERASRLLRELER
jgi:hypothetical protein